MPCSASARDRMSSTGFFHSRRCGAMADAGCWAFILGVFVIHPPNETQLASRSVFEAAYGSNWAVGTYDARFPLHSLPGKPLVSLYYSYKAADSGPLHQKLRLHHCRGNTSNRQFHTV